MTGLIIGADGRPRCWWCGDDPTYVDYHDIEWGRPTTDERSVFELLSLEAFQAGLAWITILRKRPAFVEAFDGFDIDRVAAYGAAEVDRLLDNAAIVRHRGKIEATITLARLSQTLVAEGSSLSDLVWSYAPPSRTGRLGGRAEVPDNTAEAVALSKRLKALGAKFVGPTIVYAFMQSAGMVDDHLDGCHVAI